MSFYLGDTREDNDSDWVLSGTSKELELINKMNSILIREPVARHNQHIHKEHVSSCTKFSAINAFANMFHYNFSRQEINEIEELSKTMGRQGPGYGWNRSLGANCVRKRWNSNKQRQEIVTYVITIMNNSTTFSQEFIAYMNKGGIATISIDTHVEFVQDAHDGVLDGLEFGYGNKHATTLRKVGKLYEIIDSSYKPKKTQTILVEEKSLIAMIQKNNMRNNCNIFIPLHVIPMIAKDVPFNHQHAEAIQWMIDNGLTTEGGKDKKYRPHDPVTRGEMATFLKRLYEHLQNQK